MASIWKNTATGWTTLAKTNEIHTYSNSPGVEHRFEIEIGEFRIGLNREEAVIFFARAFSPSNENSACMADIILEAKQRSGRHTW